ncbi:squalene synthetase-like protein [Lecanora helva]
MGRRGRDSEGRGRGRFSKRIPGPSARNFNASFTALNNNFPNTHPDNVKKLDLPIRKVSLNHHFSLSEEARNTERHRSWNPDLKLRHSRITFVSAGASKPEELTQLPQEKPRGKDEQSEEGSNGNNREHYEGVPSESDLETQVPISKMTLNDGQGEEANIHRARAPTTGELVRESAGEAEDQNVFFVDTKGSDRPVVTGFRPPKVRRSPSCADSTSSEEVILFAGRNAFDTQPSRSGSAPEPPQDLRNGSSSISNQSKKEFPQITFTAVNDTFGNRSIDRPSSRNRDVPAPILDAVRQVSPKFRETKPRAAPIKRTRKRAPRGRGRGRPHKPNEDTEAMDDYISNSCDLDGLEMFNADLSGREGDLGRSSGDRWMDEGSPTNELPDDSLDHTMEEWASDEIRDFDDLSTSTEGVENIDRVLSSRKRSSGVQYLVVGAGLTIDEARWLPLRSLNTPSATAKIRKFEEDEAEIEQLFVSDGDSGDDLTMDQQLAKDLQEDLEDIKDECDIEERRKERMTDEQIARLLSKQEELGLGSSELILFDGADSDGTGTDEAQLDEPREQPITLRSQAKSKRGKYSQKGMPSATTFADVLDQDPYNGFDVMDHERPSLRKKPKGRRGNIVLELSDSDLEQKLTKAWENDRSKKKIRKQEREELRSQGLLGRNGKVDMKVKYSEGITTDQVKAELRDFLLSSIESLPLPPMAKKDRVQVHQMANAFKLKSRSQGDGKSRFPVLYKTSKATPYDEKAIDAILSSKKFLPRMGKSKKCGPAIGRTGGGFSRAAVSYRDGEIVGAFAPELGQENKGRAMLEKMGWSTGTTLGALNNTRGIAQPVSQVVKISKAGLG